MNKQQKTFLGIWIVIFILYTVLALSTHGRWFDMFSSTDCIVMFVLGAFALVVLLVCDLSALRRTGERGLFLGMPLLVYSYGFTTAVAATALRFIRFPGVPLWVGVALCVTMLAGGIAAAIGAHVSAGYIEEADAELAETTQVMRALSAQASTLESQVGRGPAQKSVHAVAEAIRFSDPVSSPTTVPIEANIRLSFENYRRAVLDGVDPQAIEAAQAELLALVAERNEVCRLNK